MENNSILQVIFKENEITWKEMLLNLVKTNQLDPWDVDIKVLTKEYFKLVKKLKEHDLKVSGKVILAAAILLKIKSERLLEEDIAFFDNLMNSVSEEEIEEFYNELEYENYNFEENLENDEKPELIPRLPQLKKRRVSVYELIEILEETLEKPVKKKVVVNTKKADIKIPEIKVDMGKLILSLSEKITSLFKKNNNKILFDNLLIGDSKEDKILTFLPLLHLAHVDHRLIDLEQKQQFSDIYIVKPKKE